AYGVLIFAGRSGRSAPGRPSRRSACLPKFRYNVTAQAGDGSIQLPPNPVRLVPRSASTNAFMRSSYLADALDAPRLLARADIQGSPGWECPILYSSSFDWRDDTSWASTAQTASDRASILNVTLPHLGRSAWAGASRLFHTRLRLRAVAIREIRQAVVARFAR